MRAAAVCLALLMSLADSAQGFAQVQSADAVPVLEPSDNQSGQQVPDDGLLSMSLEELLNQQVTSAAKKSQSVSDTAAAIYVLTKDQIESSSAKTLTDLFRIVPGLQVVEVQGSGTAVSARGFSSRYASNILVMVDGAAIYNSGISGIFWDQALIPLQDIERIEIIRGPGGSLWGSNSINGVINIITKQGIDAQGVRARLNVSENQQRAELGVGAILSDTATARVYGTFRRNLAEDFVGSTIYKDRWRGGLGGIRFDLAPSNIDTVLLLSEYSGGKIEDRFVNWELSPYLPVQTVTRLDNNFKSFHVLGRWKHAFSADFDVTSQIYYNYLARDEWGGTIDRRLYNISVEGRWRASDRHELNFGVEGQIDKEGGRTAPTVGDITGSRTDRQVSGYLQDDIWLVPDRLRLTIGSKFEDNNFTGTNAQPSVRALFKITPSQSFWLSASRAVRTPLLSARGGLLRYGLNIPVDDTGMAYFFDTRIMGNPKAMNERLDAIEAGVRGKITNHWSYDLGAFVNRYRNLSTLSLVGYNLIYKSPVPVPLGLDLYYLYTNEAKARSKGFELAIKGQPGPGWEVETSWSYLDVDEKIRQSPAEVLPVAPVGLSPHHQLRLRSTYDVTDKLKVTGFVQYAGQTIDRTQSSYTKLDLRVTWEPTPNLDLSVMGSDLLDKRRVEFAQAILPIPNVYVKRAVAFEARARF